MTYTVKAHEELGAIAVRAQAHDRTAEDELLRRWGFVLGEDTEARAGRLLSLLAALEARDVPSPVPPAEQIAPWSPWSERDPIPEPGIGGELARVRAQLAAAQTTAEAQGEELARLRVRPTCGR